MNNLSVFKNDTLKVSVRMIEKNGEPWFIAKDVADALGYKDSQKAITTHCKKSSTFGNIFMVGDSPSLDGKPLSEVTPNWRAIKIIPESDLYRLIIKSELQSAIVFQDWIVEEVLPAIRKTGSYELQDNLPKTYLEALKQLVISVEDNIKLQAKLDSTSKTLESAKPKVEFFDRVVASDEYVDMVVAANYISDKGFVIGRNNLIKFLREQKVFKDKPSEKNLPYQKYIDSGYFKVELVDYVKPPKGESSEPRECVNYKPTCSIKGLNFIIQLLKDSGYTDNKGRSIAGDKKRKLPINK